MKRILIYFLSIGLLISCKTKAQQDSFKVTLDTPKYVPPEVTIKTLNNDSTYFSIDFLNDGFTVSILNKTELLKNSYQVDKFIKDNKAIINPKKILLIGNAKMPYESFAPILKILKKYKYYHFQILTR